jgi:hypothetical protein
MLPTRFRAIYAFSAKAVGGMLARTRHASLFGCFQKNPEKLKIT